MPRYTPLRLGSWKSTAAVVKALLEEGADATIKDYAGHGMLCEFMFVPLFLSLSGVSCLYRSMHGTD